MRIAMYITGLCLMLLAITCMVLRPFYTDGPSMIPTIYPHSWSFIDTWTYRLHPPRRGDMIAFYAPPEPTQIYGKRIIAISGDTLTIDNTTVILNGVVQEEKYVSPTLQGNPNKVKFVHVVI